MGCAGAFIGSVATWDVLTVSRESKASKQIANGLRISFRASAAFTPWRRLYWFPFNFRFQMTANRHYLPTYACGKRNRFE